MTTTTTQRWALGTLTLLTASVLLTACGKQDATPVASTTSATQATVPPPPGDSTPTPADSNTRAVAQGNEKTGASGAQTTVGSAAAGAPPHSLNSAPEGNQAPSQGTKASEAPKK